MKYRVFLNDLNHGVYEAEDEQSALNAFGAKFGYRDFERTVLELPEGETLVPWVDAYKCLNSRTHHQVYFFVNHANIDPEQVTDGHKVLRVYHDVCDV